LPGLCYWLSAIGAQLSQLKQAKTKVVEQPP